MDPCTNGHEHLLGRIHPRTHRRTCLRCQCQFPAEGTFTHTIVSGTLERYSRGLFAQWTNAWIREYLRLGPNDLLFTLGASRATSHDDNGIYVFRQGAPSTIDQ